MQNKEENRGGNFQNALKNIGLNQKESDVIYLDIV